MRNSSSSNSANLRLRGPILLPAGADTFTSIPDAAVLTDDKGVVTFAGPYAARPEGLAAASFAAVGLLIPPLIDCHIHIPQHPIRGRFVEGVAPDAPEGPLLAGLARNVFPAEARCHDRGFAVEVVQRFLEETRANGTHGGVAYMTSHPIAARTALELLPATWRVGLVLMDTNCPESLRIDVATATAAMTALARDFGGRFVVTDRFAVACSTPLRRAAVAVADAHGLTTQTHLAEQPAELATIRQMYPDVPTYTDVYERDGLLAAGQEKGGDGSILAHCIHMTEREWSLVAKRGARVAHCPVSNTLLNSGVMPLEAIYRHGIPWALCTDVGASPTTSLLTEMTHFLSVHKDTASARYASPQSALYHCTVAAREIANLPSTGLSLGQGFAATEISLLPASPAPTSDANSTIRIHILGPLGAAVPLIDVALGDRVKRIWPAS